MVKYLIRSMNSSYNALAEALPLRVPPSGPMPQSQHLPLWSAGQGTLGDEGRSGRLHRVKNTSRTDCSCVGQGIRHIFFFARETAFCVLSTSQ